MLGKVSAIYKEETYFATCFHSCTGTLFRKWFYSKGKDKTPMNAGVHIPLNKIYLKLYITQYVHIFRNKYTRCLHHWVKEVFCAIMR